MDNPRHIKTGVRILVSILVLAGVFAGGVYVGYAHLPASTRITSVFNKDSSLTATTDFNTFWKAWEIASEKFVGSGSVSDQDRVYGAIKGMLASFGDPYTTFFPPSENSMFESEIAGAFDGVGIEIGTKEDILTVIAPLKDTPAARAGIKSGDAILKIDDTSTNDLSIDKAINLIRGKAGTQVALTIFRSGFNEAKVVTLTREHIALPIVDTETRASDGVFIIHLYSFSANSPELFRQALIEYLNSGYHNLLLDLRGNPGGYIDAATQIGSWFIPEGKVIVKEIGKAGTDEIVHKSMGGTVFPSTDKLIVLVDKGSASASEILGGALSEQGIGILAGEQTFGKGSVQEVVKLTSDTSMKVTVAKWYTPNGVSISDSGLTPRVKLLSNTSNEGDKQLNAAVALFKK